MNNNMNGNMLAERKQLLHDIGVIDFVVVEMTLYLDTHPTDKEAMEYLSHYVRMKNQAMRKYAIKYGPLQISNTDEAMDHEWKWATQDWPWNGGC